MKLNKFYKELLRKLVHMTGLGLVAVHAGFKFYWNDQAATMFLAAMLLVLLKIEYVRLEYHFHLPEPLNLFRRKEKKHAAGWIFFVSGMIIVFASFDYPLAVAALMMTIFGDMFAALVGMRFGKKKMYKKKTYVGFGAGLLANLLVASAVLGLEMWPVIGVMAIVASVIELITEKMDDNLTVPLFSAFAGYLMAWAVGLDFEISKMPVAEWVQVGIGWVF